MEKKDLENFFDDVVNTVKDGLNKLAEKTDQLTQMGRLKLDIISIKREIDKSFSELGGRVYQLAVKENASDVLEDSEVQAAFEKIKKLEERLAAKKEEMEQVSKAEKSKAAEGEAPEAAQSTADSDQGTD
ncbi:MAG: hypothetical protein D6814_13455 [Calditrichaeota bacterium]|nr:MAG: hypothetical protein D6814_13455 [Calditrichota bacterium]